MATTGVSSTHTGSNSVIMKLNFGVIFKQIDHFDVVSDVWSQTFLIKLPKVNVSAITFGQLNCSQLGDPSGCGHLVGMLRFVQNVSNKAVLQIEETLTHIRMLIPEYDREQERSDNRRRQRGLFDFVGELSHSLFGTARESDINDVHKTLDQLKRQQHQLAAVWQKADNRLASYGSALNHRIDFMHSMIEIQKQAVHDLYLEITRETTHMSRASTVLARALGRFQDFVILLDHLNSFRQGLELLSHGMLSPSLISPADIHRTLRSVTTQLRELDLSGENLRILRPRVIHYFQMHNFLALRQGDNVILHLPIPLGILPTRLNLYQVHTVPMSTPGSARHATILTNVPKFLAFHPSSSYFLEFEEKPPISQSKLLFLKEIETTLKPVSHPSCLLSIFLDNITHVPVQCQFTVVTNSVKPQIFTLDRQHILITNVTDIMIRCKGKPDKNLTCAASCRIALPCRCTLISDEIYVPSHWEGCTPWGEPSILHSVNLALLQHFFKESELAGLYGNTLLPDPMRIFVPSLKVFEANFSHELERDKRARFDLAKLANLTKRDQTAYASLAHSMVDDWQDYSSRSFELDFSLFSWKSWGVIIIGVIAVVSLISVILLGYKLRILAASIATLSLTPRIHALPTELNFFRPTAAPSNKTDIFHFVSLPTDLTLDVTVILLLALFVLIVLIKGFRHHQKSRYQFDLYLHIGVDTSACQIWVKTFKLEPAFYCFSATNYIETLAIVGHIWPRLFIAWSTLKIQSDITNESYTLPKTVRLTWKQASYLRKILHKQYWCVLVAKTQSGYSLVDLPHRGSIPSYTDVNQGISILTLKTNASAPTLYPTLPGECTSAM